MMFGCAAAHRAAVRISGRARLATSYDSGFDSRLTRSCNAFATFLPS